MTPGQPMVRGKKAFEDIYRSRTSESSGGTHANALVDYGVDGDLAYQVGTFAISNRSPAEQGKFLNVLKHQPAGCWKVAVSMFNSNTP